MPRSEIRGFFDAKRAAVPDSAGRSPVYPERVEGLHPGYELQSSSGRLNKLKLVAMRNGLVKVLRIATNYRLP
jgi:hypothetical protein